jgi:hypothetical protein
MTDSTSRNEALARRAFAAWSPELLALFDGAALAAKIGFCASLVVCDIGGALRTSLLSVGELYAPDEGSLAFALWPTSRAARALTAGGPCRAALTFVHDAWFYQVQLAVEPLPDPRAAGAEGPGPAVFLGIIEQGEAQQVAYAHLAGGISFALDGEAGDAVLARWARQIVHLREAARCAASAQRSR